MRDILQAWWRQLDALIAIDLADREAAVALLRDLNQIRRDMIAAGISDWDGDGVSDLDMVLMDIDASISAIERMLETDVGLVADDPQAYISAALSLIGRALLSPDEA